LVLGVLFIGLVWFVRDLLVLLTTEVLLTEIGALSRRGGLLPHAWEMRRTGVEAVGLDQGLWGQLFRWGRLSVHGAGKDIWRTPFIADPIEFVLDLEDVPGVLTRHHRKEAVAMGG